MHDSTSSNLQPVTSREEAVTGVMPRTHTQTRKTAAALPETKPRSLWQRLSVFLKGLFGRKSVKNTQSAPVAVMAAVVVQEDRAATALAAQMQPPIAFRGDTANTLVTPIGTYAGKPVEQAMRKRAEQQFKNMDITTATMN